MSERRYLENGEAVEQLTRLANHASPRTDGTWLVSVLDGAAEYFDAIAFQHGRHVAAVHAGMKEEEFYRMCRRIVRSAGGELLIEPKTNGSARLDRQSAGPILPPCDAVIAQFADKDLAYVLAVALDVRNRLIEHNLTTDCGLKWENQLHARISVGRDLRSVFGAFRHVWRGETYCAAEQWENELNPQTQRILLAAGVKPAPAQSTVEEIEQFIRSFEWYPQPRVLQTA